jgi:hypothetical protein
MSSTGVENDLDIREHRFWTSESGNRIMSSTSICWNKMHLMMAFSTEGDGLVEDIVLAVVLKRGGCSGMSCISCTGEVVEIASIKRSRMRVEHFNSTKAHRRLHSARMRDQVKSRRKLQSAMGLESGSLMLLSYHFAFASSRRND